MGAGVARDAAQRFVGLDVRCGRSLARGEDRLAARDLRLLLVVTKDHWRSPSTVAEVRDAATAVGAYARQAGISLVVPALGCGLGGLDWDSTAPVILDALGDVDALVLPPRSRGVGAVVRAATVQPTTYPPREANNERGSP